MPVDYDLIRLVACCRSAARELDRLSFHAPAEDAPAEVHSSFEACAGELARMERDARDSLIAHVVARHGTGGDHHPGRDAGLPGRRYRRAGDYRVGPRARAVLIQI
jgi:hypothetical protein